MKWPHYTCTRLESCFPVFSLWPRSWSWTELGLLTWQQGEGLVETDQTSPSAPANYRCFFLSHARQHGRLMGLKFRSWVCYSRGWEGEESQHQLALQPALLGRLSPWKILVLQQETGPLPIHSPWKHNSITRSQYCQFLYLLARTVTVNFQTKF